MAPQDKNPKVGKYTVDDIPALVLENLKREDIKFAGPNQLIGRCRDHFRALAAQFVKSGADKAALWSDAYPRALAKAIDELSPNGVKPAAPTVDDPPPSKPSDIGANL